MTVVGFIANPQRRQENPKEERGGIDSRRIMYYVIVFLVGLLLGLLMKDHTAPSKPVWKSIEIPADSGK